MATTVEYLINAVGGGHGHARRGLLIQRVLAQAGRKSALLIRPGADRYLPESSGPRYYADGLDDPALAELRRHLPPKLIVDTFPAGWRGEFDGQDLRDEPFALRAVPSAAEGHPSVNGPSPHRPPFYTSGRTVGRLRFCVSSDGNWLGRFEHKTLIARHGWHLPGQPARYDRILTPYPAHRSEWDEDPAGARAAGYIIDAAHIDIRPGGDGFAVLDPEGRCEGRMYAVLAKAARRAGLNLDYRRRAAPPFRCRKLLAVGAGYHSFYELLGMGLDLRFLPVRKRYDDQFRRAERFGLALTGLDALLDWLTAPVAAIAEDTRPDWPHLLNLLTE